MPDKPKYVLAINGGAETVKPGDVTSKKEKAYREGLEDALKAGLNILERGGSAVDAVEAAICSMEDNPVFNAGRGASLDIHGEIYFDTAIMDGESMKAGCVGSVRYTKNPVKLAKQIMLKSDNCFLTGPGAEEFALLQKLELEAPSYFLTKEKLKAWHKDADKKMINQHNTVGAVALDHYGNLAAGTSTGGLNNQMKGRLSDSPIIGSGTFAKNGVCAVSCTGEGDAILRGVLAHEVYAMIKYANKSLQQATNKAVTIYDDQLKGDKGIVALDDKGKVAFGFNTNLMKRGYCAAGGEIKIALWDDETLE